MDKKIKYAEKALIKDLGNAMKNLQGKPEQ